MGPKKLLTAEEVDEIKNSLNFLTEKVSDISTQQKDLLQLLDEVKHLRLLSIKRLKRLREELKIWSNTPGSMMWWSLDLTLD